MKPMDLILIIVTAICSLLTIYSVYKNKNIQRPILADTHGIKDASTANVESDCSMTLDAKTYMQEKIISAYERFVVIHEEAVTKESKILKGILKIQEDQITKLKEIQSLKLKVDKHNVSLGSDWENQYFRLRQSNGGSLIK